jgi:inner membrane protein involved in colicin E2 resistance
VSYRSRGTSSWTYPLAEGASRVSDFHLEITTNFARVDFPAGSISPSSHRTTPAGWEGRWDFDRLVANAPIGIELPEKLNPGPLASRITFFAPVGLLFFFFVVALVSESRAHGIHPMNYFFFGCAFFAFHLLFAYLVDHVAILPSFAIAALVSIGLVVSYARLFTPASFAARVIGGAQLIYLVMFSATFFWEGFTGLSISVGAVLTLFVMMQLTGRTDWRRTAATPAAAPAGAS